jgi:phage pi2 protein 07
MQKCGFIFLNKRIWFDYKKKVYSLNKSNVPDIKEPVVLLPAYAKKLYVKKSRDTFYVMYLRKRHDWQRYHIAVMEAFIGRKFKKGEGVHHINGNTLDNSIRNLCLVTNAEHQNAHKSLLACAAELFRRGLLTFSNGEYKCG